MENNSKSTPQLQKQLRGLSSKGACMLAETSLREPWLDVTQSGFSIFAKRVRRSLQGKVDLFARTLLFATFGISYLLMNSLSEKPPGISSSNIRRFLAILVLLGSLGLPRRVLATCPPDPLAERDRAVFVFRNLTTITDEALEWCQRQFHGFRYLLMPSLAHALYRYSYARHQRSLRNVSHLDPRRAKSTRLGLSRLVSHIMKTGRKSLAALRRWFAPMLLRLQGENDLDHCQLVLGRLQTATEPRRKQLLDEFAGWLSKRQQLYEARRFSSCEPIVLHTMRQAIYDFTVCQAVREKNLDNCQVLERFAPKVPGECRREALRFGFLYSGNCDQETVATLAREYNSNPELTGKFCRAINNGSPGDCPGRHQVGPDYQALCQALARGHAGLCEQIGNPQRVLDCQEECQLLQVVRKQLAIEKLSGNILESRPFTLPALRARMSDADCVSLVLPLLRKSHEDFSKCLTGYPASHIPGAASAD